MDRWLPQRLNSRVTVLVVTVLAATMLLVHTAGPAHLSPAAALGEHYSRLSSAAHSRLQGVLHSLGRSGATSEPLSEVFCSEACPCACQPWWRPTDGDPPEPAFSNCGPTADRRGAHQNVLAYTFFGTNVTAYLSGVQRNAMRALEFYPGWTMRIYYDGKNDFPAWNKTACELICQ